MIIQSTRSGDSTRDKIIGKILFVNIFLLQKNGRLPTQMKRVFSIDGTFVCKGH
jgi:hypothetical protein